MHEMRSFRLRHSNFVANGEAPLLLFELFEQRLGNERKASSCSGACHVQPVSVARIENAQGVSMGSFDIGSTQYGAYVAVVVHSLRRTRPIGATDGDRGCAGPGTRASAEGE